MTENSNLNIESHRLKTFDSIKIHEYTWLLPIIGFYYVREPDVVKCYFCCVEIGSWQKDDNPITEHVRWSEKCPLMKRKVTSNVPTDADTLSRYLPPQPVANYSLNAGVRHPFFIKETDRLKSFDGWPSQIHQSATLMSQCGYFYTGNSDRVACHNCGGGVRGWNREDDPYQIHALLYPDCKYLKKIKGEDFINNVRKHGATPLSSSSDDLTTNNSKVCKICFVNEVNSIINPCRHVFACLSCAHKLENRCSICFGNIDSIDVIYFS